MQKMLIACAAALVAGLIAGPAMAADIECDGKKLIIVDKLAAATKAKMVFVSKDQLCGIGTNSIGSDDNDPSTVSATFEFAYGDGSTGGSLDMPQGVSDGQKGWLVNKLTVSKYVNKGAPGTGATKVAVIKPGKLLKAVGKSLGDSPIDIFGAGEPTGSPHVRWNYTVNNAGGSDSHCGGLNCKYKLIAGDTGAKLVCKDLVAGIDCSGSPSGAFID